jgi:putative zinc finger/helix-turn-helix YgiT family protein
MKCLHCNNDQFVEQNTRFTPEIKGEVVEVIVPCMICNKCNAPLMNNDQMNVLRKATADKYREIHGLLTSSEIIAYRENLGMSQAALARYLNVGEASIKRWETYFIQDASQNELIRLKCDEASAEINYLDIQWKQDEPNIYNGYRKFNLQIFKNVALFLTKFFREDIIYIMKFHFYVDFIHFEKCGTSLTGACYSPLKYGPCPDQYRAIYAALVSTQHLKKSPPYSYEALTPPDLSLFDDNEKQTLETMVDLYKKLGAKKIFDLSHKERGYEETKECDFISYTFAKDLLITKQK